VEFLYIYRCHSILFLISIRNMVCTGFTDKDNMEEAT
jgi:hypothetical protein